MSNLTFKDLEREISAPVTKKVRSILDELCEDIKQDNTLSIESLSKILGRPPVIPDSPDTDAMLDAYDAKAEYGRKAEFIEDFVREYVRTK